MAQGGGAPPNDLAKAGLRRRFLELRQSLGPAAGEAGIRAEELLLASDAFADARSVMVYLPFRGEVPTDLIVRKTLDLGKVVSAPVTLRAERRLEPYRLTGRPDEFRRGAYGILEPDPARCEPVLPGTIDLVVVPGVAFDRSGGRLGYGGGYYDRFLAGEAVGALRVALAFEVQLSAEPLPLDAHDLRMDLLVTERRILRGVRPARQDGRSGGRG